MKEYLFSYGTLQKKPVQIKLFGRTLSGEKDIVPGFITSEIDIEDEAFLAKGEQGSQLTAVRTNKADDRIDGTVFEVSTEELVEADGYEPDNYYRARVTLGSGKEAWLYLAADPMDPLNKI